MITQGESSEGLVSCFLGNKSYSLSYRNVGPKVDNQWQLLSACFGERVLGEEMSRVQSMKLPLSSQELPSPTAD